MSLMICIDFEMHLSRMLQHAAVVYNAIVCAMYPQSCRCCILESCHGDHAMNAKRFCNLRRPQVPSKTPDVPCVPNITIVGTYTHDAGVHDHK